MSRVRVPGVAAAVEMRPEARTRSLEPIVSRNWAGRVNFDWPLRRLVAVVVFVRAVPAAC